MEIRQSEADLKDRAKDKKDYRGESKQVEWLSYFTKF